jgi:hypothetical protein
MSIKADPRRRLTRTTPNIPKDPASHIAKKFFCGPRLCAIEGAFVAILRVAFTVPFVAGVSGFGEIVHVASDGHPPTVKLTALLKLPCDPIAREVEVDPPAVTVALFPVENCSVKSGCEATTNPVVDWL